ncbi:MAG: hypothetical protein CL693_06050 [Cellvibrionaceae bacterium]|nr:hypothetical protein [Cellvibrionaceae bacterium]
MPKPLISTRPIATLLLSLLSTLAYAERDATGDDGREIILKDNGSWEYKSTDRFATSEDGTRVRLKENGSWEFIGNAPVVNKEQVRTEALDVQLGDIVTEFYKEKVGKNTRHTSQTVFNLKVDVSSYSDGVDAKLSHFNLFEITDSRGNQYPILSVTPQHKRLQAGKEYTIAIRVDGSPSGQFAVGIKHLSVNIDKSVFGTHQDLSFSRRADEIKRLRRKTMF